MQALWVVFQILAVIPFLSFITFAVAASLIDGEKGLLTGLGLGLVVATVYLTTMIHRERVKIRNHIDKQGIDPDYLVLKGKSAIAIDQGSQKIFAGNTDTGGVVPYSDITNIRKETREYKNSQHHKIIISTNDFELPYIEITIPGTKGREAFEKLRVALGQP